MTTPHKHAEFIKQWADGTEIEFLNKEKIWEKIVTPSWNDYIVYRVKPKPTAPIVHWLIVNDNRYAIGIFQYKATALKIASEYNCKLMRLEIDTVTLTATCVLEEI